jgi:hypothetical protein
VTSKRAISKRARGWLVAGALALAAPCVASADPGTRTDAAGHTGKACDEASRADARAPVGAPVAGPTLAPPPEVPRGPRPDGGGDGGVVGAPGIPIVVDTGKREGDPTGGIHLRAP